MQINKDMAYSRIILEIKLSLAIKYLISLMESPHIILYAFLMNLRVCLALRLYILLNCTNFAQPILKLSTQYYSRILLSVVSLTLIFLH